MPWLKNHRSSTGFLVVLSLTLMCAGCAGSRTIEFPLLREMASLPAGQICRVAVLPFVSDSQFPQAATIVKKIFMLELLEAGGYQIIPEADILKTYQQLRLYPGRPPSLETMKIVANRVGAQVLITGTVAEMREDPGPYSTIIPKIVLEIQIRDGRNGTTLWETLHRRLGSDYTKTMHFGTIHSIAGLSRQMSKEIIDLWFEKGLTRCNVLSQASQF